MSDLWCGGLIPDTVGCGVQGVPKLEAVAQLVAGQGLACYGQAGSAGCGTVVFLWLVSTSWWAKLVQGLGQASWWVAPCLEACLVVAVGSGSLWQPGC